MDKLQPILKFHFWILLFFALILAFVGWWMTTGEMQAAIAARRGKIEDAKKKIPTAADAASHPNSKWDSKLKTINAKQDELIRYSREWLYTRQKEAMVWPAWIPEEARSVKYFEDFKEVRHRVIYRDNYMKEVLRVYEIPKPIEDPQDPEGIVIFPFSLMPHREWGNTTPTSKQMWESMEDLWLLEPLLKSVYETNGGQNATRHDAPVVSIEYIRLHGGDRAKVGQSSEPQGDSMPGGGGGAMPMGAAGFGGPRGGDDDAGGAGRGLSQSGPAISDEIKPIEEFGDPGMGDMPSAGGDDASPGGAMPMGAFGGGDPKGGFGGGFGSNGEEVGRRYIDDDEKQPFKTRGFMLTVIMDHRKVPDLYQQLTSSEGSPWPIKILRMNVADFKESGAFGGGGGGAMRGEDDGPGFGGGGFGPAGFGGGKGKAGGNMPFKGGGAKAFPGGMGKGGPKFNKRMRDEDDGGFAPGQMTAAENPLEKPYLARVTVLGLITMYREPPKVEGAPSPGTAAPGDVTAGQPADPAAAAGEAAAAIEEEVVDPTAAATLDDGAESMPADDAALGTEPAADLESGAAAEDAEMKNEDEEAMDEAVPPEETPSDPVPENPGDDPGTPDDPSNEKPADGEPVESEQ